MPTLSILLLVAVLAALTGASVVGVLFTTRRRDLPPSVVSIFVDCDTSVAVAKLRRLHAQLVATRELADLLARRDL